MDIQIAPTRRWPRFILLGGLLLVLAGSAVALSRATLPSIALAQLSTATVEQGDLTLYSNALGQLIAVEQRLLTAPAAGTVVAIAHRPGSPLTEDTVILQLENPELNHKVQSAERALQQKQAEIAAFTARQQSSLLEQQGVLAELQALVDQATLELSVNQELAANGIAARIELQRAELRLHQQQQRLHFEQHKYQQFAQLQLAEQQQKQLELTQLQQEFDLLRLQQSQMQLSAGMVGILQQLEVEIGESVQQGQALARVGSQHQLNARIQLHQRHASQVLPGQPVLIETPAGVIQGEISRIESVINQGTVSAEVQLPQPLPAGLRPMQQIHAQVELTQLQQALSLPQLPGLRPNSSQRVFIQTSSDRAEVREVRFGELSQRRLLVEDGLNPGDKVLSIDASQWPTQITLALRR
ncbi:HlyD family efflux transporter periplasmic adaptor subunit [Alkalimonas sp. NCh-2]|uniref:efflux RND transporter periplasmic adaptor subunit n=1 Tax=Alkalimonas sp. NCh-2 TaxID=3144846 RepID=UPI0031F6ACD9